MLTSKINTASKRLAGTKHNATEAPSPRSSAKHWLAAICATGNRISSESASKRIVLTRRCSPSSSEAAKTIRVSNAPVQAVCCNTVAHIPREPARLPAMCRVSSSAPPHPARGAPRMATATEPSNRPEPLEPNHRDKASREPAWNNARMVSPPVPSKVFGPSLPIRQLSRNRRAALRNGSCRACHAVGARNIARLRAQSRPAYCDAPKPSFEKAPEGKAPPKISGCRANGADITRTNAPQHQGSSRLPAVTPAVIGAHRKVRPRRGNEYKTTQHKP